MTIAETSIPTTELTAHDVMVRAKETLNAMGWCKLNYKDNRGHLCLMGALCESSPYGRLLFEAVNAIKPHIRYSSVTLFNDDPFTTYEDVVGVLDQAIKDTTPKDEADE